MLTTIILLGMLAQWLAWRFKLPSILILLLFGTLAGPVTGLVDPDALFGGILFPFISISVAVILFEGGLELSFRELPKVGSVLRNLLSIGLLVTWVLIAAAAYLCLNLSLSLSILLGAILVVTGPTVIGPMLRLIRPTGRVASILKWEGIIIDPIGAILAVLVFEAILSGGVQEALASGLMSLMNTVFIGALTGGLGALLVIVLIKRYWLPDFLQSPVTLMLIMFVFAASNLLQPESGLLSVTVMGVLLANQKDVSLRRIEEFKENLRVLLISSLFIILAARMKPGDITHVDPGTVFFLVLLIVVIRPIAVFVSTIGAGLSLKERFFISWMAPRGIVAAAVASVFSFELVRHGYQEAEVLVPITFLVIMTTVSIYSLTAPWLALKLGLSTPNPQGVLFVGGHTWARALARSLQEEGIRILVSDTNFNNVSYARRAGLKAQDVNVLTPSEVDDLDLNGIGRVFALTQNDGVNSLATVRFASYFGAAEVYQLSSSKDRQPEEQKQKSADHLRGRILFNTRMTYSAIEAAFRAGCKIRRQQLPKDFNYENFQASVQKGLLPLFLVTPTKDLIVFTADRKITPRPGQTLISIDLPEAPEKPPAA